MKLTVLGPISSYYVQTLVLLWFPGEKFPENSEDETLSLRVTVGMDGGNAVARVQMCGEGKSEEGTFVRSPISDYPMSEDRLMKLAVGKAVNDCLGRFTGSFSPWGILTGVRPAKVASEILSFGVTRERAEEILSDVYLVNEDKAKLCTAVSLAENALVTPKNRNECSVYVAIPFCPTRCAYCSFVSFTSPNLLKLIPEYLFSLIADIDFIFREIERYGMNVATVYVGGGTPTVLDPHQLEALLSALSERLKDHRVREFTVEAGRPDTITKEKLSVLSSFGVSRISVNTQTLNDDVLRSIGRSHSSDDFFSAYSLARSFGISEINVDLIAGLPGESRDSSVDSARRVAELRPENLTVHSFSVKKSASLRDEGVYDSVGVTATKALSGMHREVYAGGYIPYYMYRQKNTVGNLENVGFSLPGHECMYNIYMMEEIHTVWAVGASSVTKLVKNDGDKTHDIKRIFEAKYPYEYLKAHSAENAEEHRKAFVQAEKEFFGF